MEQKLQSHGRAGWLADLSRKLDSAEQQLRTLCEALGASDRRALQQRIDIARAELERLHRLDTPIADSDLPPFWRQLLVNAAVRGANAG